MKKVSEVLPTTLPRFPTDEPCVGAFVHPRSVDVGATKMKKVPLVKELKQRGLHVDGPLAELRDRLLEAVKAEKEAADEERREASMTEEERIRAAIAASMDRYENK